MNFILIQTTDDERLDDAIDDLVRFSLVKRKVVDNGKSLYVHPLISLWVRETNIIAHNDKASSKKKGYHHRDGAIAALALLSAALCVEFHERASDDWLFETSIASHISLGYDYIQQYAINHSEPNESLAWSCCVFGMLDFQWERCVHSVDLLHKSSEIYRALPQPLLTDAKERLLCCQVNNIGHLTARSSEFPSISWEDLLTTSERLLNHFQTTERCRDRLYFRLKDAHGGILKILGRRQEALSMRLDALQGAKLVLGLDDVETISAMHNVGSTYTELGDLDKAQEYYKQSAEMCLGVRGVYHTETANTFDCLGDCYNAKKSHAEAVECYRMAYEGYRGTLGRTHVEAIRLILCLIRTLFRIHGREKEMEDLATETVRIYEEVEGKEGEEPRSIMDIRAYLPKAEGEKYSLHEKYERAWVLNGCSDNGIFWDPEIEDFVMINDSEEDDDSEEEADDLKHGDDGSDEKSVKVEEANGGSEHTSH